MASVSSILQGKDTTSVLALLEGRTGASLTSNSTKRWAQFNSNSQSSSCTSASYTCCCSSSWTLYTSSSSTSSSPCNSLPRGIRWQSINGSPPHSCFRHRSKLGPLPAPQLPSGQVFPSSSSALAPAPGPLSYAAMSIIFTRRRRRRCEAIRTPNSVTAPTAAAASSSFCPNTTAVAAAASPPVQVIRLPAAATESAAEDVFTAGILSKTLLALVRVQEERLFTPAVFNASKLRVLRLGKHDDDRPLHHPRIYTLTHSDLTAKITLAVAREINKAQVMGWYNKLQRDEVLAEWRRAQGEMSLHVHCHISGTNFLHMVAAKLRFFIFQKELPLVLEAFLHGDRDLFKRHPELQRAPVWVYFHSNVENYNRVECWGPLCEAMKKGAQNHVQGSHNDVLKTVGEVEEHFVGTVSCLVPCECCSPHATVIPIPESLSRYLQKSTSSQQPVSSRQEDSDSPLVTTC